MNLNGYQFAGPYNVDLPFDNDFGAIYAIIDDVPKVLDIGQTGSINDRVQYHDRRPCWDRNKSGALHLYILVNSSEQGRLQIEQSLRNFYNPLCGVR